MFFIDNKIVKKFICKNCFCIFYDELKSRNFFCNKDCKSSFHIKYVKIKN